MTVRIVRAGLEYATAFGVVEICNVDNDVDIVSFIIKGRVMSYSLAKKVFPELPDIRVLRRYSYSCPITGISGDVVLTSRRGTGGRVLLDLSNPSEAITSLAPKDLKGAIYSTGSYLVEMDLAKFKTLASKA